MNFCRKTVNFGVLFFVKIMSRHFLNFTISQDIVNFYDAYHNILCLCERRVTNLLLVQRKNELPGRNVGEFIFVYFSSATVSRSWPMVLWL